MLGLTLREEFRGKLLKGTAIELTNAKGTGATQVPAASFLEITYPSFDLRHAIEAIGPSQGRPVVLIGERGQGKSHLMAALYHALTDSGATQTWLDAWAGRLGDPKFSSIPLRSGMEVISESLHKQRYKTLWDLLLDKHPDGSYIRGKWEAQGASKTDIPSDSLILELLQKKPTALLLDEFQTWFDGLVNTKQEPKRNWAFNFIQILSEIAAQHPDLLLLVVSVRDGGTDAYQQIHRVNPVQIDFKSPNADRDRRRLLLHRLFENRINIATSDIDGLIGSHISEYFRLTQVPPAEQDRKHLDFVEAWPFAPHLLQLLEDQVLVATAAQETRDLIRILADLYKSRGEAVPLLTTADFRLDDDDSTIASLLDSVANEHHRALREKAQRNFVAVRDAVSEKTVPHLSEIIGALWLRSLAIGNAAGASPAMLQVDVTRGRPIDDNAFQVELSTIVENSFNIHPTGDRYIFREDENPQAKLMSSAKNDKLFTDGSDHQQLAAELRYVLAGTGNTAGQFRVVVLPQAWLNEPWARMEPAEQPTSWDERLPILVLPEDPDKRDERLGLWLKEKLQQRRNTVRFLLPRQGSISLYQDRELIILARAVLKANEWSTQSAEYSKLLTKYRNDLRTVMKTRFDRFAVIRTWNFADPTKCKFQVENLKAQGDKIPDAIEETLARDVFVPEDFEDLVLQAAAANDSVGKFLKELQEPRPNGADCIPWLGETAMKERLVRLCAKGKIAISIRGTEYLQANPGEDSEAAWMRMRGRLGTGKHLDETQILQPSAVPATGGATPPQPTPVPGLPTPPGGGTVPTPGPTPIEPTGTCGTGGTTPTPCGGSPGGLFGGGSGATPAVKTFTAPATSSLNLLGKTEGWGINAGSNLRQVTLRIDAATGAQLEKLLKSLPDGMTYELNLEKEG